MYAIEFQTRIKDGVIEVPEEQREALLSVAANAPIRVIILTSEQQEPVPIPAGKDLVQDAKDKGYDSFIDYLIDHPVRIPNMTYLTREEANAR
ncbi:hypothetical protein [Candidatus Leptofilum sp.]|uniref:hypothetical protein n=1 Tax=Candidatus Leptofilum sp. TaxID=3241576 RepID=UPI003B5A8CB6